MKLYPIITIKKSLLLLFVLFSVQIIKAQSSTLKNRLIEHVHILASDSLQGRQAGSDGAHMAADYIIEQFKEIGLKPFVGDSTYRQKFIVGTSTRIYSNIIGYLEGSDPILKDEYIIIGAHYDHLGLREKGSETVIYNGADDNASGTAAMIEIARRLRQKEGKLARTILFVAFDAEEIGLHGSEYLASILPAEQVKFMISMDMVGWLQATDELTVAGVAMLKGGRNIMESVPTPAGLNVHLKRYDKMIMGGSDHDSFASLGVPAFYATTGLKSPYHKPEDTAEKIDYSGMALVTEYLGSMTEEFASGRTLIASGKISPKHRSPVVEFALSASIGSSKHNYLEGALTGKSAFSWNAGAFVQFNVSRFALRSEILYHQRNATFPNEDDIFKNPYRKFTLQSVTVPVNLIFKFPKNSVHYFYVGAGGYYAYNFGGKLSGNPMDFNSFANRNDWGMTATFGGSVGPIGIAFTSYSGYANVLKSNNTPKISNSSTYFSIYYKF